VTDDEPLINEYLPTAHAMQSDSASFPLVSRYVTGGQSRYVLLDDEQLMPEYLSESHLPVAHATQSDSASLISVPRYLPGTQTNHPQASVAPCVLEYLPALQLTQSADPVSICTYL
jgi:hypothetical protein